MKKAAALIAKEKEVTNKMPSYVMLLEWTEEEIKMVKDAPKRVEFARNTVFQRRIHTLSRRHITKRDFL